MSRKPPHEYDPLTDEVLEATLKAHTEAGGNIAEVARQLGLSRSTVHWRLKKAAERGLVAQGAWAPRVPEGYRLRGVSTLVDETGAVRAQWFKAQREQEQYEQALDAIQRALADAPVAPRIYPVAEASLFADPNLLTLYAKADLHLGMYVWSREAGEDYDADTAWKLLQSSMVDLVENSPPSAHAVLLDLGDFFHTDNDLGRTLRSGNPLDTDTRFGRVLRMGVDLTILAVQLALQKHEMVTYRALAGNHDPYASLALGLAVGKYFEANPRVTVDLDPSYFWVMQFGKVMLAGTHGDMTKPDDMPGLMAARWPTIWGATRYRYAHLGHVHHKSKGGGEKQGVVWETHQTLAPKDSWHYASGYTAGRSMTAITYHKKTGERFRTVRSVGWQ